MCPLYEGVLAVCREVYAVQKIGLYAAMMSSSLLDKTVAQGIVDGCFNSPTVWRLPEPIFANLLRDFHQGEIVLSRVSEKETEMGSVALYEFVTPEYRATVEILTEGENLLSQEARQLRMDKRLYLSLFVQSKSIVYFKGGEPELRVACVYGREVEQGLKNE